MEARRRVGLSRRQSWWVSVSLLKNSDQSFSHSRIIISGQVHMHLEGLSRLCSERGPGIEQDDLCAWSIEHHHTVEVGHVHRSVEMQKL